MHRATANSETALGTPPQTPPPDEPPNSPQDSSADSREVIGPESYHTPPPSYARTSAGTRAGCSKRGRASPSSTSSWLYDSTRLADPPAPALVEAWVNAIPVGAATPERAAPLRATSPPPCHSPLVPTPRRYVTRAAVANKGIKPPSPPPDNIPFLRSFTRSDVTRALTRYVDEQLSRSEVSPAAKDKLSIFFSVSPPPITTQMYIRRVVTYTHCSPSAFVIAMVYLVRIGKEQPRLQLSVVNMHRLFIASVTLAVKLLDDRTFSIGHYARVGGVPTPGEMVRMEVAFLEFVRYDLLVTNGDYDMMLRKLRLHEVDEEEDSIQEGDTVNIDSVNVKHVASHVGEKCDSKKRQAGVERMLQVSNVTADGEVQARDKVIQMDTEARANEQTDSNVRPLKKRNVRRELPSHPYSHP